jgi:lipid-binding SYLF domain-containing protein
VTRPVIAVEVEDAVTRNIRAVGVWGMAVAGFLAFAGTASAQVNARLETTVAVFDEITSMADKSVPEDLLEKAECIAVVPGLKKGAFVVGAKYGRGFVACRKGGVWSAPAAIVIKGGSVGYQIGGSETDVMLAVMNKRGVDRLLSSKFTLGADASIAAGPVGRTASAETDAKMTAEILSWSRTRGVFAGVALGGATLTGDDEANRDLYGKKISVREIVTGDTPIPAVAQPFIDRLSKY